MDQTQETEGTKDLSIEDVSEKLTNLGNECIDWLNEINPTGSTEDFCKLAAIFGYRAALKDIANGKYPE